MFMIRNYKLQQHCTSIRYLPRRENLSRLIKRGSLWNLWNVMLLKLLEENFRDPFRDACEYAHFTRLRAYFSGKWRETRRESTSARPTRKAARISGPFDEMPNVPLFTQQRRSNTGSCPFPRCRRTPRTWGEIPERSRVEILPRSLAVLRGYLKIPPREKERETGGEQASGFSTKASRKIYERYRLLSLVNPGCALSRVRGSADFFCGTVESRVAWL